MFPLFFMARVYMNRGQYKEQLPSTVPPNGEGKAVFGKTSGTACGAVGVFTFDLWEKNEKKAKKIAVMFSAPYNHDYYSNLFAMGFFDINKKCDYNLYYDMYYNNSSGFCRHHGDCKDYEYVDSDDLTVIKGSMEKSHVATLRINVCQF